MAFGLAALLFEQIIPHISARDVQVRANPLEHTVAKQKFFPNFVVPRLDLPQGMHPVELRESHQQQQAAEAGQQQQTAVHDQRPGPAKGRRLFHLLSSYRSCLPSARLCYTRGL